MQPGGALARHGGERLAAEVCAGHRRRERHPSTTLSRTRVGEADGGSDGALHRLSGGRARLRRVEQPCRRLEAQAVAPLQHVLHGSREGSCAERLPEPHHAAVVDAAHPNPTIELVLEVIAGVASVVTRPVIVFVAAAAAAPTVPVAAV